MVCVVSQAFSSSVSFKAEEEEALLLSHKQTLLSTILSLIESDAQQHLLEGLLPMGACL